MKMYLDVASCDDIGKARVLEIRLSGKQEQFLYNKGHRPNMGPNWVLSAPFGPHVGPINLVIMEVNPA